MGQAEYQIFLVLVTFILLLFIGGIILFVFRYHKRKLAHEKEKTVLNEVHAQELLTNQLRIQQQTMADIGREIHDNVGQRLTLASIYANQLVFENEYPLIGERIGQIGSIINESLAELRSLSRDLTNDNVAMGDFAALVQNECTRVNGLNMCKASCSFNRTDFQVSGTVKNFIVRIIQEFIQNSLKHADCRNIDIACSYDDDGLAINASDDGKGFDASAIGSGGIGLANMKKRAELIGATLSVIGERSKGTKLHLFITANKLYA